MANGLLDCGWVEYWEPNVALGSLKGLINGIDFGFDPTSVAVSIVDFSGFPCGKSCRVPSAAGGGVAAMNTAPNSIFNEFGLTDVLFVQWFQFSSAGNGSNNLSWQFENPDYISGFNSKIYVAFPSGGGTYVEMPGSDQSFPTIDIDPDEAIVPIPDVPHCMIFWWTVSDLTMHTQFDGGKEYTFVSPVGMGPPNTSAYVNVLEPQFLGGAQEIGEAGVCRGTIPNATQRALLFGGLPFDQWDHAGGGGGITYSTSTGRRAGMGNNPPMSMVGAYRRGSYGKR